MPFFNQLMPLLQRGVKFNIAIERADALAIAVSVTPTTESSKASGFNLTPRQFTATPAEFDEEFVKIMAGYSEMTSTLLGQLEAAKLVAEATAQAAAKEATKQPEKPKAVPAKSAARTAAKRVGAQSAATLLSDEEDESDDTPTDADNSAAQAVATAPAAAAAPAPAAQAAQPGLLFEL